MSIWSQIYDGMADEPRKVQFGEINLTMPYLQLPETESDQRPFEVNISKAQQLIGWATSVYKERGIMKMIEWTPNQ